ncbi:hypothetical protein [Streptomyces sp. NPDC048442]|uniref:hypothetical protein n=1 Tax=Streptomyces sp. NPDC048442 TaxID=3154823 RepID=UPI00341C3994
MTREEIAQLVHSAVDLGALVRQADLKDKAAIYQQLGLTLTYDSGQQKVRVEMNLNPHCAVTRGLPVGVRGGT